MAAQPVLAYYKASGMPMACCSAEIATGSRPGRVTAKERGVEGRNKNPGGKIFVLADSYIAFVLQYGLDAFVLGYMAIGEDDIKIQ